MLWGCLARGKWARILKLQRQQWGGAHLLHTRALDRPAVQLDMSSADTCRHMNVGSSMDHYALGVSTR